MTRITKTGVLNLATALCAVVLVGDAAGCADFEVLRPRMQTAATGGGRRPELRFVLQEAGTNATIPELTILRVRGICDEVPPGDDAFSSEYDFDEIEQERRGGEFALPWPPCVHYVRELEVSITVHDNRRCRSRAWYPLVNTDGHHILRGEVTRIEVECPIGAVGARELFRQLTGCGARSDHFDIQNLTNYSGDDDLCFRVTACGTTRYESCDRRISGLCRAVGAC